MSLTRVLPMYRCHKTVQALKIADLLATPSGIELHFEDNRFAPHLVDAISVTDHNVVAGCYLVVYETGIVSFLPGVAFEQTYLPVEDGQ